MMVIVTDGGGDDDHDSGQMGDGAQVQSTYRGGTPERQVVFLLCGFLLWLHALPLKHGVGVKCSASLCCSAAQPRYAEP